MPAMKRKRVLVADVFHCVDQVQKGRLKRNKMKQSSVSFSYQ